MPRVKPSASYSFTIRLRIRNRAGMLAKVLHSIARLRCELGAITNDELSQEHIVPSIFNKQVAGQVARAVEAAARRGDKRRARR